MKHAAKLYDIDGDIYGIVPLKSDQFPMIVIIKYIPTIMIDEFKYFIFNGHVRPINGIETGFYNETNVEVTTL